MPPGTTFKLSHLWHPFSLCPSLSFRVLRLSSSLVQQLWSRVRVKGISRAHTQGCATVRLECSRGCGGTGLDFPMPIVNCWLYLKLRGDLHCPLDPSPGPWPLAQRLCLLPCWDTQWTLCVCMCELCVLMANLRRGSVIQSSAIQPPASTSRAASPSPRASHLSLNDNELQSFPPQSKPSLFP